MIKGKIHFLLALVGIEALGPENSRPQLNIPSIEGGRMKKYILLSLIVILTIPGCSIFNRINLNGIYKGTIQGTQNGWSISMSVDMTLNQIGDRVNGTWNTSGGTSGTLSGDIQGDNIKDFTIIQSNPCSGTFTGSAVIYDNGEEIRGNYHGTSCYGTVSATVEVFKQ